MSGGEPGPAISIEESAARADADASTSTRDAMKRRRSDELRSGRIPETEKRITDTLEEDEGSADDRDT
jgi:hypothetical protein